MSEKPENGEWYDNKRLYEMLVEVSKRLEHTDSELGKTQTLIRDYNGLREIINDCKTRLERIEARALGSEESNHFTWEKVGYMIGLAGLLWAIVIALAKIGGG